jgi:hypothetical protein
MSPVKFLDALPAWIRNFVGYQSAGGPAFWITNALIALLVPIPLAAPVLVARFRRTNHKE